MIKTCIICGKIFETSYWNCVTCGTDCRKINCKQWSKKYYENNKEYIKELSNEYYKNNKECAKKYYENNKERAKKYYKDNKERAKKYNKEYRENNKEYIKELLNEYYKNNKECFKIYDRNRNINLTDGYIANVLKLKLSETTPELLELKRIQIKILRECRNVKQ